MKSTTSATILMALSVLAVGAEPVDSPAKLNLPGPPITLDLGGGITLEAVFIPAGKFMMGRAPTEKDKARNLQMSSGTYRGEFNPKTIGVLEYPQHEVTISKAFYMGKYEVTNEQYERVMGYISSARRDPKNPAEGGGAGILKAMKKQGQDTSQIKTGTLTWEDTQTFCKKVCELTGKTVRLPTEAEWECAVCVGGPPPVFAKEDLDEIAWWAGNSEGKPHPVGQKTSNAWGLYDLFGNVYEWTQNWFSPYTADPVVDPKGPDAPLEYCPYKVVRGGWWGPGRGLGPSLSTEKFCKPGGNKFSRSNIGFRVVVEVPEAR